jgi:hypothetical protein
VLSLGIVLAALGVGALALRRRIPVTLVFLAGYVAVILAWPFEPTRFALVWWPVLAGLATAGVRTVWTWRPAAVGWRWARVASLAGAAMLMLGYGADNVRGVRERWWANIQSDIGSRAKPIAQWVVRATRPEDVVITDHDLIVYLYTGRRAVPTATFTALSRIHPLTPAEDAVVLRDMLMRFAPRWYITTSQQGIDAATLLVAQRPPRLRFAGSIGSASVYEPVSK